jgi:transposase
MHECPKCQSDRVIKNGSAAGKPKKQCKPCGYQFTRTTPRGKPLKIKINAVLLYLSGISMNRIAFLLRVSAQTVLNWIRTFATEHSKKPDPTGKTIVLELDEMWHDLKRKRRKLWIWKALDRDTGQLLDWECGRRDKTTLKKPHSIGFSGKPRSSDVENCSNHEILFLNSVWMVFGRLIRDKIISAISMAWDFTTKSWGIWFLPLHEHGLSTAGIIERVVAQHGHQRA